MSESFDLVVEGGVCLTPAGRVETDLGIRAGRIAAIGDLRAAKAAARFVARGLHVLPGVIVDRKTHV